MLTAKGFGQSGKVMPLVHCGRSGSHRPEIRVIITLKDNKRKRKLWSMGRSGESFTNMFFQHFMQVTYNLNDAVRKKMKRADTGFYCFMFVSFVM